MRYVLAVAIFATLSCTSHAIKCYHCDSALTGCGEEFKKDDSFELDCAVLKPPAFITILFPFAKEPNGCLKIVAESNGGNKYVSRSCFFGDLKHTEEGCKGDPGLVIKQLSCDVCESDLCNRSSVTAPLAAVIVLFFVVARMMS